MTRLVLSLLLLAPGALVAQPACRGAPWGSIGVAVFHCPGGTCAFTPPRGKDSARFSFTSEPWLRGIDATGPAAGRLRDGDVLEAVNQQLVTTPDGGRLLARLPVDREARLLVRRGGREVIVPVRPRPRCEAPLVLVGTRMLHRPAPAAARVDVPGVVRLDYTMSQRVGTSAVDQSLGMALRCGACELLVQGDSSRWSVRSYPVVDHVVRGGVAEEAGLEPGDEIRAVNGRDVRDPNGRSPLFALPRRDFTIGYTRRGVEHSALMNRRIQDVRHIVTRNQGTRIRIQRTGRGRGDRLLGTLARWWQGLTGRRGSDSPVASSGPGDEWRPLRLGMSLRSENGPLFTLDGDASTGAIRFAVRPVVAAITDGGPAEAAGLRPGDVVTTVDGEPVTGAAATRSLFFSPVGSALVLTYSRAGDVRRATLFPLGQP